MNIKKWNVLPPMTSPPTDSLLKCYSQVLGSWNTEKRGLDPRVQSNSQQRPSFLCPRSYKAGRRNLESCPAPKEGGGRHAGMAPAGVQHLQHQDGCGAPLGGALLSVFWRADPGGHSQLCFWCESSMTSEWSSLPTRALYESSVVFGTRNKLQA